MLLAGTTGRSSFAMVGGAGEVGYEVIGCEGRETRWREGGWLADAEVLKASRRSLNVAGCGVDVEAERPSSQGRMIFSISMSRLRWSGDKVIGFTRLPSRSRANDPFSFLIRRMPGSSMVTTSGFAGAGEEWSFFSCGSSAFRFLYPCPRPSYKPK